MEPEVVIPAAQLRRGRETDVDWTICFICQEYKSTRIMALSSATEDGISRFKQAVSDRAKFQDTKFIDVIDRVDSNSNEVTSEKVCWHRTCYATFTSQTNINRLKARFDKATLAEASTSTASDATIRSTRQCLVPMDWGNCLFCQKHISGEKLHNIECMATSQKILQLAKFDAMLRCRLAGVSDLIASEGKYHLKCYVKVGRRYSNINEGESSESVDTPQDICFNNVMYELKLGLAKGGVYTLSTVWKRYSELLQLDFNTEPCIYRSNRFKDKIQMHLGNAVGFVKPLNTRESLLIFPNIATGDAVRALKLTAEDFDSNQYSIEQAANESADMDTEVFNWLFRVAVKVHADISAAKGHEYITGIDRDHVENVVPDSLYLLLNLLCKGDEMEDKAGHDPTSEREESFRSRVLCIAQDIIFLASGGHKQTPKHIGIGLTVHQATRSKSLIKLLHAAGHCVSYESVQRMDTSIANDAISRYIENDNVVIPRNFMNAPLLGYVRYANDNIDINEETLDGRGTFHASQTAALRRDLPSPNADHQNELPPIKQGRTRALHVPPGFNELQNSEMGGRKPEPVFRCDVTAECLQPDENQVKTAEISDMTWILARLQYSDYQYVPGWSGFNERLSHCSQPMTIVGHLPIINAPAHDFDTLWTVMNRCVSMSERLGQAYSVITFDEALYSKAKLLQWQYPDEMQNVVIMLGGFHVQLNFAKVIGQHMEDSGLRDIWVESGVYGQNTADNIINGKIWNRVIRAHKLTYEALWHIMWPAFIQWAIDNGKAVDAKIKDCAENMADGFRNDDDEEINNTFASILPHMNVLLEQLSDYYENSGGENPTFSYWRQYMELVSILLRFTRAAREGNWALYVSSFAEMLPWFAVYDHVHYTRWGSIFIADMQQLEQSAPPVYEGFISGDFVVKESHHTFNQIPDDQGLEHVNRMGKVAGGLVGITRNDTALDRWSLSYNERAQLADDTRVLLGAVTEVDDDDYIHKDSGPSRMKRDHDDVQKLKTQFERFKHHNSHELISLTTGDVAPDAVKTDLLKAQVNGASILLEFVTDRLVKKTKYLHDPLTQRKSQTFASLYKLPATCTKQRTGAIKADRDLFHRIIIATEAGQDVNIDEMLEHEMSPVPLALATIDGKMRKSNKAELSHILQDGVSESEMPQTNQLNTCTIIDGMMLVQGIGKPAGARTFGDLADIFRNAVFANFINNCSRVDVVFDRYLTHSVKSATRDHRSGGKTGIRRVIDNKDIRLPDNWNNFISVGENKASLAGFLSDDLSQHLPGNGNELILSGGFEKIDHAYSSADTDVSQLCSTHEEADTRIVLHTAHARNTGYERVVVHCQDTDVLVLLVVFSSSLTSELWMRTGTSRKRKFIAIHNIELKDDVRESLLSFHSITGCDTTSQFCSIGKKTAWKVLNDNPSLLLSFGNDIVPVSDSMLKAESFVCKMYKPGTTHECIQSVRSEMFRSTKKNLDNIPPTQDALVQHLKRAHLQTYIWRQSLVSKPDIPLPINCGWKLENDVLLPLFLTKNPVHPSTIQLITCGCTESGCKCQNKKCSCTNRGLRCSGSCKCLGSEWCMNPKNRDPDA